MRKYEPLWKYIKDNKKDEYLFSHDDENSSYKQDR